MKVVVVLSGLVCLALSEAPYPPSGWKPSGALLVLPSRQQLSRLENQQPRQQQPPSSYGPPQPAQPNYPNQDEGAQGSGSNGVASVEQQSEGGQAGSYYVLLPDGKLQRIQYTTAPATSERLHEGKATGTQDTFQQGQNTFGQQFHANSFNGQNFQGQDNLKFQVEQTQRQNSFNQQSFRNERFGQNQENLGFGQATNNVNTFQRANNQQNTLQNRQNTVLNSAGQKNLQPSSEQSSQVNSQAANDNSAAPPKLVAQFSEAQLKANGPFPDGFVASVQFSEVPPITAPVYVFNPAPLVRVLRMTP